MEITFAPRDILQIDDARIVYRNFSGKPKEYNREGDRNFHLVIPDTEIADALVEKGWNVKVKPPREEGDDPFITLPVKVKFSERGPRVYLVSNGHMRNLTEETVGCLDSIDILSVSLDIRPYDWDVSGKTGRTAYLQSIKVVQDVDRFAQEILWFKIMNTRKYILTSIARLVSIKK